MRRKARFCSPGSAFRLVVVGLAALALTRSATADAFDRYTNPLLIRLVESKDAREVEKLTPNQIIDHDRVLPGIPSAFVVVKTNGGRYSKLLVQSAKQKVGAEKTVPILLVERFVTFKDGEERQVFASGKNVSLYPGFRLSLDLGQVVPEELGGDLRFVVNEGKVHAEPVGKAKLYLVTRGLNFLPARKGKFVIGDKVEPRHFNGTFKLHDDGRRSGTLTLKVNDEGGVSGFYYSDKDGARYDVKGKVGNPTHTIEFVVRFPRIEQSFKGMLFTGNGLAIAGTSRLLERETAFYAIREE